MSPVERAIVCSDWWKISYPFIIRNHWLGTTVEECQIGLFGQNNRGGGSARI